jgi:DMSO/TMAO reductase YedYZ molybdopterin-dependent catalytic subunit
MGKKKGFFIIFLLSILMFGCNSSIPDVDWTLEITGEVEKELKLSFAELVTREQTDLEEILMEKSIGDDEIRSWTGVSVEELFIEAGVTEDYVSVTAKAADGYMIEISRDEMDGAIIAFKDGGEWIVEVTPDNAPIRLVTPLTPANRWVYQITELQINK